MHACADVLTVTLVLSVWRCLLPCHDGSVGPNKNMPLKQQAQAGRGLCCYVGGADEKQSACRNHSVLCATATHHSARCCVVTGRAPTLDLDMSTNTIQFKTLEVLRGGPQCNGRADSCRASGSGVACRGAGGGEGANSTIVPWRLLAPQHCKCKCTVLLWQGFFSLLSNPWAGQPKLNDTTMSRQVHTHVESTVLCVTYTLALTNREHWHFRWRRKHHQRQCSFALTRGPFFECAGIRCTQPCEYNVAHAHSETQSHAMHMCAQAHVHVCMRVRYTCCKTSSMAGQLHTTSRCRRQTQQLPCIAKAPSEGFSLVLQLMRACMGSAMHRAAAS